MRLIPWDNSTRPVKAGDGKILTLKEYLEAGKESAHPRRRRAARLWSPDNPLEHQEQATLIRWRCLYEKQIPPLGLLFAIPNAGAARLRNLQTEGVLRGVADLFLAYPSGPYHGLFIEMKRIKGGRLSEHQLAFMQKAWKVGYSCEVCHGAEEAWKLICTYLGVKDPR